MVTLFHDIMHKEIEVYVDDMIAKSRTEKDHVQVLRKLVWKFRKFQLKLNPTKCTFGAMSGKLLGFVVNKKGIEIDPDKVRAIQELLPPYTQKEVRRFLGRLNYIARFISQLTEKCEPIFCLLKKHNPGVWDEEYQKTFNKVKHYLSNALVLMPPSSDKPLILYLAVKRSSIVDLLASRALEDYKPLNFDFPNEDLMYVATTEEAIEHKIKVLEVYGDSTLVIYQLKDENQMANSLATLASMVKVNKQEDVKPIQMSICKALAYSYNIEEEEKDDHPWYHDILRYIKNREYLDQVSKNDKKTLRRLANVYILDGEILYKRRKDQVLLICVDAIEAKKILEEVHEGVCETHANGFIMARQIMSFGYY
ncbi:reverse transcriptase [Gossypium australe]|uniref:Reverse transcriptase n=1 Tax=Gossypium australe TaxID=47621 RepID=A0A5B6VTK6_9ROSI|nr:reverse transcriptase [Gossypium australe]